MVKTQLEVEVKEIIQNNLEQAKEIIEKQTHTFSNLLLKKIMENFKELDKERLKNLFFKTFTTEIVQEIDALFKYYKTNEIEFYSKNLKISDLIFNTLNDNRTQKIYLENLMKKINEKKENVEIIFNESLRRKINVEEIEEQKETQIKTKPEEYSNINTMFDNFVRTIIKNPRLSMDEANDLFDLSTHYFQLYKHDVTGTLEKLFDQNKTISITKIEHEMDNKEIRNGKSSAISKIERKITDSSLKAMEQLLSRTVDIHKNIAKEELKNCSSSVIDLILKLLPLEYEEQKDLIEIIVDTNINERLGKLLDNETKKLVSILKEKNEDLIENELYEEKRYKTIEKYVYDLELVGKVYKDVLNEIKNAYHIIEGKQEYRKINLKILSESESTKTILKNFIYNVVKDNQRNLKTIILEMHHLSEKAQMENGIEESKIKR